MSPIMLSPLPLNDSQLRLFRSAIPLVALHLPTKLTMPDPTSLQLKEHLNMGTALLVVEPWSQSPLPLLVASKVESST
jgi:hypothetical protein